MIRLSGQRNLSPCHSSVPKSLVLDVFSRFVEISLAHYNTKVHRPTDPVHRWWSVSWSIPK